MENNYKDQITILTAEITSLKEELLHQKQKGEHVLLERQNSKQQVKKEFQKKYKEMEQETEKLERIIANYEKQQRLNMEEEENKMQEIE